VVDKDEKGEWKSMGHPAPPEGGIVPRTPKMISLQEEPRNEALVRESFNELGTQRSGMEIR